MYEGEIHTDTGQPYKIEKPPKKSRGLYASSAVTGVIYGFLTA